MLFSSFPFLAFFAIYLALHLALPPRWRLTLVIIGSTVFYGYWNPWLVWVPHALMLLAYGGALWTEDARGTPVHRRRLTLVVAALLVPLALFKYTNFVYRDLFGFDGTLVDWPLPLGISFVTFTTIAYVVDVYRGHYPVERKAAPLAGLVLFFPHLIAGPILRPTDLLPQLKRPRPASRGLGIRMAFGVAIFSVGLLKKLVFADTFAGPVQAVFDGPGAGLTGPDYLLAWYGFALQIYCDFSGYVDMAIGVAMILGVKLPENFRVPYGAASVADFWRRWHITLSRWLRDYVYIPLGGSRHGPARRVRNVTITMALGGLWHGASWTFVVWGLWHALGIFCAHAAAGVGLGRYVPYWLRVIVTFHFVCLGWILFRAADMSTAWRVMMGPFAMPWAQLTAFTSVHLFHLMLLAVFFTLHRWDTHRGIRGVVRCLPAPVLWGTIVFVWVLAFAMSGGSRKFIYFDF